MFLGAGGIVIGRGGLFGGRSFLGGGRSGFFSRGLRGGDGVLGRGDVVIAGERQQVGVRHQRGLRSGVRAGRRLGRRLGVIFFMLFVVGGNLLVGDGVKTLFGQLGADDLEGGAGREAETGGLRGGVIGEIPVFFVEGTQDVVARIGHLVGIVRNRERGDGDLRLAVEPAAGVELIGRGDVHPVHTAVGAAEHAVVDDLVLKKLRELQLVEPHHPKAEI